MTRIDDLPPADFAELEAAFEDKNPVCSIGTLERVRSVMTEIIHESPRDEITAGIRSKLEDLVHYTTAAMVMHRSDVESDDAVKN